ncbi:hypothetical protein M514_08838, partial [Trichuris suis]
MVSSGVEGAKFNDLSTITFRSFLLSRASSVLGFSRISTFIVALLLIVYGSIRSLSYDENKESERFAEAEVISKLCALAIPILGSIFLLISFYCFDSFQFVVFHKISSGMFGRYSTAEIVSLFTSLTLPWLITGHWLLLDALAVGLSVSFITLVRLPTLKISSFAINTSSPAVHVLDEKEIPAAENIAVVSRNFDLIRLISDPPKLSLPANLVFSSLNDVGRFTILRLGDMVAATTYAIRQPSYRRYFSNDVSQRKPSDIQKHKKWLALQGDLPAMWSEPFEKRDEVQL